MKMILDGCFDERLVFWMKGKVFLAKNFDCLMGVFFK
jgi:hypothetical protein